MRDVPERNTAKHYQVEMFEQCFSCRLIWDLWVCKRVLRSNKTDLWKHWQCSCKVNLVDIASLFIIWPTRPAGKINQILRPELSCPLRTTRRALVESHIINLLLTKVVRSSWLDIVLVLLLRVYGPRLRPGPKTRKKTELGQYPAILTSCWFETWRFQFRIFYVLAFL